MEKVDFTVKEEGRFQRIFVDGKEICHIFNGCMNMSFTFRNLQILYNKDTGKVEEVIDYNQNEKEEE